MQTYDSSGASSGHGSVIMSNNNGYPVVSYLLQQTLRRLCTDSDWVYAVFWRILPRNYPPPKWDSESSILDRSKGNKRNWILVWEDGFCDFVACAAAFSDQNNNRIIGNNSNTNSIDNNNNTNGYGDSCIYQCGCMQPELFFKMSHDVYNFGEGLMGKVAADNSHKWIYREPTTEADSQYPASWQGAIDPHPRTWEAQFRCGIETIAVVAVKEGLLQLGSLRKTTEDLNFVLFLQRKFNYLQSIPGVYAVHPVPSAMTSKMTMSLASAATLADAESRPCQPVPYVPDVDQGTSLQALLSRLPSVSTTSNNLLPNKDSSATAPSGFLSAMFNDLSPSSSPRALYQEQLHHLRRPSNATSAFGQPMLYTPIATTTNMFKGSNFHHVMPIAPHVQSSKLPYPGFYLRHANQTISPDDDGHNPPSPRLH